MRYSPEVFEKVNEIFDARRKASEFDLEKRLLEAQRIPGIAEINARLDKTALLIMSALRKADGGAALADVQKQTEELVAKREELLIKHGYPADFCDPKYHCPICLDSGYDGMKHCACMQKELYAVQAELSGLGNLLGNQSFENFDVGFYDNKAEAQALKAYCMDYATRCFRTGENLVLMGGTGLGKTHLSTAIAEVVMKNGGGVIYESVLNILSDFQFERFGRGFDDRSPSRTDKYFEADLLIMDDLGCEVRNQFSVSVIYQLLNSRLNSKKAMLLSTNLSQTEMLQSYDQRITSRLLGEFKIFELKGKDIRLQKLLNG